MAKRLPATTQGNGDVAPASAGPEGCRVCGGPIRVEDLKRADRYPKRLRCAVCEAEYGTTRPDVRNY